MIRRPRVNGPVLLLLLMLGCAPFGKQPVVGPWTGGQAPAIEGTDSQARVVRLADYRGKVVLLSFWHGG